MGRLRKAFSTFVEYISLSTPRAIVIVLSFLLLLIVILPFEKLFLFPARSLNKYIFPLIFGNFFICPTEGFLENCCPSCGLTRASSYLLHGNLTMAWYHNPLVFIIIPLVLFLIIYNFYKWKKE